MSFSTGVGSPTEPHGFRVCRAADQHRTAPPTSGRRSSDGSKTPRRGAPSGARPCGELSSVPDPVRINVSHLDLGEPPVGCTRPRRGRCQTTDIPAASAAGQVAVSHGNVPTQGARDRAPGRRQGRDGRTHHPQGGQGDRRDQARPPSAAVIQTETTERRSDQTTHQVQEPAGSPIHPHA